MTHAFSRILFEIKAGSTSGPVLKDLLFKAYELGVKVKFSPVSISDYEIWVKDNANNAIRSMCWRNIDCCAISRCDSDFIQSKFEY
jgi:transcriptional regulator